MQVQSSKLRRLSGFVIAIAAAAVFLSGCNGGSDGAAGPAGPAGATGPGGPAGADKTTGTVDAAQLTFADLKDRALGGKILSVDTSGDQPVVSFQVVMKDTNEGVRGLRTFALHIDQLQPEKDGSASYWQNYIADGLPLSAIPAASAAPVNPSADSVTSFNTDGTVKGQGYSVVDNGDGTYKVTFGARIKQNTKVPYNAALTHRVVVGARSVAVPGVVGKTPGAYAGPMNPLTGAAFAQFTNTKGVNFAYDFTPSATGAGAMLVDSKGAQTFARDNVTVEACNQCHYDIEYGFPRGNNTSGHFGSRTDTKTCVMCHTPQLAFGQGDFTNFLHKIHMGEELAKVETVVGVAVNEVKYPQDHRNCAWCHKGAVTDSWNKPTLKACGACHNGIDFSKPSGGHVGGVKTDDKTCVLCHDAADIALNHVAVAPPDPNNIFSNTALVPGGTAASGNNNTNAAWVSAAGAVPAGANKITYAINSVTRNASKQPVISFKFQKDGTDVVFNTYSATGKTEIMDNFVGSPSIYFAWSVPQDGIAAPADYNATASTYLKNIWRGDGKDAKGAALAATAVGTLTGPSGGNYTLTLTGVTIPDSAKMLTGGIGYTYGLQTTLPLTQIDLAAYPYTPNAGKVDPNSTKTPKAEINAGADGKGVGGVGGLSVPPRNQWKVATGYTGRRLVVDTAKCNACHAALGVKPTFHAGQRNDAQTCTFCHTVNRTNSGWPVNINYDVHAIHGGSMRSAGGSADGAKFSWEATAGAKYWEVGYPGLLKNCEQCHIAGMYDFSNTFYTAGVPNLLMTTAASGTIKKVGDVVSATDPRTIASVKVATTGTETFDATNLAISPFVTSGTDYGAVFSFNANTGVSTPAAGTTLVLSPISAACSGCHASSTARAHMQINGGSVFEARSAAQTKTETCLVCHGPANNAAFNETVPTIKAVHRWW